MMNVRGYVFSILVTMMSLTFATPVQAAQLEKCLISAAEQEHRIDKENAVNYCFTTFKEKTTKADCFANIKKFKPLIYNSQSLTNNTTSICFYEAGTYSNIGDCLKDAGRFNYAGDHDDAVFYCYQSFQETITKKDCLLTADKLIYAGKRDYLKAHCLEN
ncbi:MAG: hypothetical protein ACXVAX_10805 [Pseudobdellovibrio sp.]